MRKKKVIPAQCPICDYKWDGIYHKRTRHHIFPKWYYLGGLKVYACSRCHQYEFHVLFPMIKNEPWSESVCVQNWVNFCELKGKNAYVIYPELTKLQPLY